MLIKINLLPPHFRERRSAKFAWGIVALLLVIQVSVLVTMHANMRSKQQEVATETQQEQQRLAGYDRDLDEARGLVDRINERKPLLAFIEEMAEANNQLPELYEVTARQVYERVSVVSMAAGGEQFTMEIFATNLRDLARFFQYIQTHPRFRTDPPPAISSFSAYTLEEPTAAEIRTALQQATGAAPPQPPTAAELPPSGARDLRAPPGWVTIPPPVDPAAEAARQAAAAPEPMTFQQLMAAYPGGQRVTLTASLTEPLTRPTFPGG